MKELKTIKKYVEFSHKDGSKYYLEDYDDDGLHCNYTEVDKNRFWILHKVLRKDKDDWDELCRLYPLY